MTGREKGDISTLQREGYGYKVIARKLGLPVNSVKSHCARHPITVDAGDTDALRCRTCGKPLVQIQGKREKVYCSDACRMKWWNAHTDQVKRKAFYTFTCPQCGRQFESYGN